MQLAEPTVLLRRVLKPRIPPPSPGELATEVADLLRLTARQGKAPPGTMAILSRQPHLLSPFLGWAAALALQGALPKRDHELLALRAAWNCQSPFEWDEHAELAYAAGLGDDEIRRVGSASAEPSFAPHEEALVRAADELHASCAISDETWSVLAARYDVPALVEIPLVVGQYTMLSMLANAAGLEGQTPTGLPPRAR